MLRTIFFTGYPGILRIKFLFLLSLLFFSTKLQAQQSPSVEQDMLLRDIIESLAPDVAEDYDLSELEERLNYLQKHPINLNNTNAEELKALVFLSPLQISNYFQHIKENGKLIDLLELQSVDGFDVVTVQRLLPFVRLSTPPDLKTYALKNLLKQSEQEFLLRYGQVLEKQKGFTDLPGSRYLGSPEKLLGKYKYRFRDLVSANLVVEKDAGEYFFSGKQKPAIDFISGNVTFYKLGIIKKAVLGDYSLQFGQGLTIWTGFGYGKGPDVTSVARKDLGLLPYSSSNENSFLRGIATTLNLYKHLELTTFFSSTNQDASTKTDSLGQITQVNISTSGLHRSKSELKNRSALQQTVYGASLQYLSNNLNLGMLAYQSRYSNAFVTGPLLYNRYNFTGNLLNNAGIHYNYTWQNIYFYGESAKSFPGGFSTVNGAMASLSRSFSMVLLNRNYAKDYHNFLSRSPGENTDGSNEKGWYSGLNFVPDEKWAFSFYGDVFKFPWLKYRIDGPSKGYEWLAQAVYNPTKTFKTTIRIRTSNKQQNPTVKSDSSALEDVLKSNYRIAFNWRLSKEMGMENRFEAVNYAKEQTNEYGFLAYQDLDYRPTASRFSGNIRLAYFNTASYNSRVYAYEDDVLYSSGFGMYNGKGIRCYVNLKVKLSNKLGFWARYAVFIYQGVETVGSGLDQIQGNKKMDVKFQLRYQF